MEDTLISSSAEQLQSGEATNTEATTLLTAASDGAAQVGEQVEEEAEAAVVEPVYEFKAPEGIDIAPEVIATYTDAVKAAKLSPADAQSVLEKVSTAWQSDQIARITAVQAQWKNETLSDKTIGGDKLPQVLVGARQILETAGTPALLKLLNDSGLGNNKEVLTFLHQVRQLVGEDKLTGSATPQGQDAPPSGAEVLYPSMKTTK